MDAKSMIIGFAPWILFSVAAERVGADHVTIAAGLACLVALALALYEATRSSWKILDVAGVLTFGVIAVIGIVGNHEVDETLVYLGRGGSTFILAAVMAISAFTIPFTEQYARESVDQSLWKSPIFRAKNRSISLLWAGAVFLIAIAHTIAGALAAADATSGAHPGNLLLNWIVPIALIIFAVKRTRAIADGPARTLPGPAGSQA